MRALVTGGAGFIGSELVRQLLQDDRYDRVVVLDDLRVGGSVDNLPADDRLHFHRGDICSPSWSSMAMRGVTHVVHAAAESHVDRSLLDPCRFVRTNVEGTQQLLTAATTAGVERFVLVSTDEVYGSLGSNDPPWAEGAPLLPRQPYAASKAAAELVARAHSITTGLPVLVTRGSNTYGPRQHSEKLLPRALECLANGLPIPMYGDGSMVREWLHVSDHARGILTVLHEGQVGETYNIGGADELEVCQILRLLICLAGGGEVEEIHPDPRGSAQDWRYSIDTTRLRALGWRPEVELADGLRDLVDLTLGVWA